MFNNPIRKFYNPLAAVAAGQEVLGTIQTVLAQDKINKLLKQRTAYTTPQEIFKILQATQSRAGSGYDPATLSYLTNQTDRAFDKTTGDATRLGANPNDLSAIFDQKIQAIMKIGAENHAINLANFDKFLSAEGVVAENRAAEWKSQQDILKDKLQAAGMEKAAGVQNVGSALNAFISMYAANKTAGLYADKTKTQTPGLNQAAAFNFSRQPQQQFQPNQTMDDFMNNESLW